ncbi:MAG: transglutaminaseTgpA domain-containing protein [Candidatus Kaelpia imicola]|nr:transglutaminaseTgpA domain-containing protein [Candidatus Kaelpia imicola]
MFYIISFLLVSIGITALPLIEGVGSSLILAGSIFTFGFVLTQLIKKFHFSKNVARALLFIALIIGVGAFFTSGNSGEWAIVWLIWYLILSFQVISIFSSKDVKGWFSSYLLSFIQLSLGGIFTEKLLFLVIFSLYLALSVFGFIFLLPKIEIRDKILKLIKPRLDLAKWGALTTVNVFFITGLVFLILPRTQSPLFAVKKEIHLVEKLKKEVDFTEEMTEEEAVSLPEEIELGTISELKNENKMLMLIETERPFLFRAQAFNYYDGSSWIKYGSKSVTIKVKDNKINFKPLYLRKELFVKTTPDKFYHQKFYIKNYSQNLILSSYPIIGLSGSDVEKIKIDHFENIYLQRKLKFGDEYEVISVDKSYPSNYLRSLPRKYPREIMDLYLQLPPNIDKRLMDLTSKILKYTPTNIYDELITLRKYLKEHCIYSRLNTGKSPTLYEFLFDKKPGDCEYFATALALMLRYRNIPTRFVIGFSGGEFDSQKRTSIIYAKNAHAWIEVFFPTIGWLPCDATPKALLQEQWEEAPKMLALKPQDYPEDRGFAGESGSGETADSKQSLERQEIAGEGIPEEELLPQDYYFKDRLSQHGFTKEEIVFSEEFFEEAATPAELAAEEEDLSGQGYTGDKEIATFEEERAEGLLREDEVTEEIFTEEEAEEWFYREEGAFKEEEVEAETESISEDDVFEEVAFSEERVETAVKIEKEPAEGETLEEDLASFYQDSEDLGFTEIASGLEQEEKVVEEEVLEEKKLASLPKELEEGSVRVDLEDEFKKEDFGKEEDPADSSSITEASLEEGISEQEYLSEELLSSGDVEVAEKDVLSDEGLTMEDSVPLEQEVLLDQEIQDQEIASDLYLDSSVSPGIPITAMDEEEEGEITELIDEEDDIIPDLDIVEEEVALEEDVILEELPAEDLVSEEESLEESEEVAFEEDTTLEEEMVQEDDVFEEVLEESAETIIKEDVVEGEVSEEEDVLGEVEVDSEKEDLKIVEDIVLEEIGEAEEFLIEDIDVAQEFTQAEEIIENDLPEREIAALDIGTEVKEEKLFDDIPEIVEEESVPEVLLPEDIEDKLEDSLGKNILFKDDFELIVEEDLSRIEDVAGEEFEAEDVSVEDMIPEEDSISGELGFLFNILKDKLKEWIFGFSYYTQALIVDFIKGIFVGIKSFIYGIGAIIYSHLKNNKTPYSLSIVTFFVAFLLWALFKELIRKKKEKQQIYRLFPRRKLTNEEKKVRNFYLQILDLLAKAGYKRLPNFTPREFAYQLIGKGFSISKDFYHLTDMFYRISFGQIKLKVQELKRVDIIAASIREWTKEVRR